MTRARRVDALNPDANGRGIFVALFASNMREVFRGEVTEAHNHTWRDTFMGYRVGTNQRVIVRIDADQTHVCLGPVTGPWLTFDNIPDPYLWDERRGRDNEIGVDPQGA